MVLDRLDRQVQGPRDQLVRLPLEQQLEDVDLAGRQPRRREDVALRRHRRPRARLGRLCPVPVARPVRLPACERISIGGT